MLLAFHLHPIILDRRTMVRVFVRIRESGEVECFCGVKVLRRIAEFRIDIVKCIDALVKFV